MSFDVDQTEVAAAMESAPEQGQQSPQNTDTIPSQQSGQQGAAKEAAIAEAVSELEKLGKFKFQGKEWTAEDLKNAVLRQEDYTRKTMELSKEAKYQKNLYWDLEEVRKDPALAAQFRQLYPKEYHPYVDKVLQGVQSGSGQPQPGQQASPNPSEPKYLPIDPEVAERFERVESYVREKEVSAIESQLETWDAKFADKYKLADQESVYAKADALYSARKAEDPNFKFTEQLWEKLYQADHQRHTSRYEGHYRTLQKSQLDAGLKGRDVAAGGGTPSQGPKEYRTIREATNAALAELDG